MTPRLSCPDTKIGHPLLFAAICPNRDDKTCRRVLVHVMVIQIRKRAAGIKQFTAKAAAEAAAAAAAEEAAAAAVGPQLDHSWTTVGPRILR